MSFLKKIFGRKEELIRSYSDFWNWFQKNEKTYFEVVKNQANIEKDFFDQLSPKLDEINKGFFYLTGMYDDDTVELVFTADGDIKNIVFVEELVAEAPVIKGWKFTALKSPTDIENVTIRMAEHVFDSKSLFFYSNEYPDYPDEIDITIIHNDWTEENKQQIGNGTYIFLDNYLGELDFVNHIDSFRLLGRDAAEKELVPIAKLKDFLTWRQKEFIEKYNGFRYNTENDRYSGLKAELTNGKPLIAIINSTLLSWDKKASHPWILKIEINYDGQENDGLPDNATYQFLDVIEDQVMVELPCIDGYLNIGRQSADNFREIYFACKEFRKPSKVLHALQKQYAGQMPIEYTIYKDKYWQSFERFIPNEF